MYDERVKPLEVLFESPGLPEFDLPDELAACYGGNLGFAEPHLYANFVESIDGVTAIPSLPQSNRLIAGGSEQDRFVMGLLRACADVILIGAGTLYGSPQTQWTAEHAYPPGAGHYAELRRCRGMAPLPKLAIVSGSGKIDPKHPGLLQPTIVVTSEQGAKHLKGMLPSSVEAVPMGDVPRLDLAAVVKLLRDRGYGRILCEGGPMLLGALAESNLLDELFLTISPRLAGRSGNHVRLSLIENAELLPNFLVDGQLRSVRRAGSHLFLRYEVQARQNHIASAGRM